MAFSFIQLADPQFGMFAALSGCDNPDTEKLEQLGLNPPRCSKVEGFEYETKRYSKAISLANKLNPAFVVTCGDLCNNKVDPTDEYAELMRITSQLNKDIPMHWVSGNHDVSNTPTQQLLTRYRGMYGDDVYSFDVENCHFIVLNSTVCQDPSEVWDEWIKQLHFLESDLKKARSRNVRHIVVFTHHPPFLIFTDEADNWLVIPKERRIVLIDLFIRYGVSHIFSGHWHRNHHSYFKGLEIVSSSSVGYPLGPDPSGIRVVNVDDNSISHKFLSLE